MNEKVKDALSHVDERYVSEAARRRRRYGWVKYCALAACALLAVGVGWFADREEPLDMPALTCGTAEVGFGMESYWVNDASELPDTPWEEGAVADTLPVFKNVYEYDSAGMIVSENLPTEEAFVAPVAQRLGDGSGAELTTFDWATVEITLDEPVPVPEEDTAAWLVEEYAHLLAMEEPVAQTQDGAILIYDAGGDMVEDMLNYYFARVIFYPGGGELDLIRVWQTDLSQKVGDYPIITQEEAEELLREGKYATSAVYPYEEGQEIGKVEIVYRNGILEEYYMPYYRFLVLLPEEGIGGTRSYGAYYVPAVEGKYITNMPSYDGSFD